MAGLNGMPLNNGYHKIAMDRAYVSEHKGGACFYILFQHTDINKPMPLTCGELDASKAFI